MQNSTKTEFDLGGVFGIESGIGIAKYGIHRFVVTPGFLYTGVEREAGTDQIAVRTSDIARFDLTSGYDLRWKAIVGSVRIGAGSILKSSRIVSGEPNSFVEGDQIVCIEGDDIETKEATGVDFGLLAGLGFGIEFGGLLFGVDDLIEINLRGEYLRISGKNDLFVFGTAVFWFTSL